MKPFDLEAVKRGEPCTTKEGMPARYLCELNNTEKDRYVFVVTESSTNEYIRQYCVNGSYYSDGDECDYDLVMVPKKKKLWINIDKNQLSTGRYMTSEASEFASEIASPYKSWLVQIEVENE